MKNSKYSFYKELYLHLYLLKTQINYFLIGVLPFILLGMITGLHGLYWLVSVTAILSILDVRSRYIDFVKIRKKITGKNYMRYVESMHFSPCRRNVTAAAYGDIKFIKDIYHDMGYRWYHMLPNNLLMKIVTVKYWKAALFRKL